MAVLARSMAWV